MEPVQLLSYSWLPSGLQAGDSPPGLAFPGAVAIPPSFICVVGEEACFPCSPLEHGGLCSPYVPGLPWGGGEGSQDSFDGGELFLTLLLPQSDF